MISSVRLSTKGLMLVAVPTAFEIICVTILFVLLQMVQAEKGAIAHGAELVLRLDSLLILSSRRATNLAFSKISNYPDIALDLKKTRLQALAEVKRIDELVKDRPDEKVKWDKIKVLSAEIDENLHHATTQFKLGNKEEAAVGWARYQLNLQELFALHKMFTDGIRHAGEDRSSLEQHYYKQIQIVLAMTICFGVLLAFGLAVYFNRSTAQRLNMLTSNAREIAIGRAPLHLIGGKDELAELHGIYTAMHNSLSYLREKEQALLSNAAEGICSFDANLSITTTNESFVKMFSDSELVGPDEELVGRRLASLIAGVQFNVLKSAFEKSRESGLNTRAETSFFDPNEPTATDKVLSLSWSIVWSQRQNEFFCVVQDISEAKRMEVIKSQFLAMVSHDLRSPLAAIEVTHSLLMDEGELDSELRSAVEIAQASTVRLLALVNNLLDLDSLENNSFEIERVPRDLAQTITSSVNALSMVAKQKRLEFRVELETSLTAYYDHHRITQVLINLLSNAIRYSPSESAIRVNAVSDDKCVTVSVEDEGPGLSEDKKLVVFSRYQTASPAERTSYSGIGLGLAICKTIVEKHGGRIGVESDGKTGSKFSFTIPKSISVHD